MPAPWLPQHAIPALVPLTAVGQLCGIVSHLGEVEHDGRPELHVRREHPVGLEDVWKVLIDRCSSQDSCTDSRRPAMGARAAVWARVRPLKISCRARPATPYARGRFRFKWVGGCVPGDALEVTSQRVQDLLGGFIHTNGFESSFHVLIHSRMSCSRACRLYAFVDAPADHLVGEEPEPSLYLVDPR